MCRPTYVITIFADVMAPNRSHAICKRRAHSTVAIVSHESHEGLVQDCSISSALAMEIQ